MNCPQCEFTTDSEIGFKQHMTKSHGRYTIEDLKTAGITPNTRDHARALDSGRKSIDDTLGGAPDVETAEEKGPRGARQPRVSKEARAEAESMAEFERIKPILINKWKRRLRILYGVPAKLLGDPAIALSEEELTEGGEIHFELMVAMGWKHAGKIEAVGDVAVWHAAMILSRSTIGQQIMASFTVNEEKEKERPN